MFVVVRYCYAVAAIPLHSGPPAGRSLDTDHRCGASRKSGRYRAAPRAGRPRSDGVFVPLRAPVSAPGGQTWPAPVGRRPGRPGALSAQLGSVSAQQRLGFSCAVMIFSRCVHRGDRYWTAARTITDLVSGDPDRHPPTADQTESRGD